MPKCGSEMFSRSVRVKVLTGLDEDKRLDRKALSPSGTERSVRPQVTALRSGQPRVFIQQQFEIGVRLP